MCVTSFGLDGPNAHLPGSGTLGEAFAGLTHLTGDPAGKPVLASVPLGDAVTGWVGAFGVLAACYERANGGGGRVIDVNPARRAVAHRRTSDHRMGAGPAATAHAREVGCPAHRSATRTAARTAHGWRSAAAHHVTSNQLLELVGHRPSADDIDDGEIDRAVAAWAARTVRAELIDQMAASRLPVAPVHDASTLRDDPHVVARDALRVLVSSDVGERVVPAPAPRFAEAAQSDPWCSDAGAHNEQVLRDVIGLDADERARLEA